MSHDHNQIILMLMIKNESKIIERCLSSAIEHIDGVCILDTGSTDNTVEVCKNYLEKTKKPFAIAIDPFVNFGHSRSISFKNAVAFCRSLNWNPATTYALALDGDMIIRVTPEFNSFKLTASGYTLIQRNSNLSYTNTRFLRCDTDWVCIGATHEYWSGGDMVEIDEKLCWIDDLNDGGCKSDKTERDIRLLTESLKQDPTNARTHFYLAQSYKDIGKCDTAIEFYKKRIEIGGWEEEVWYAHYMIGLCYYALKEYEEMECWLTRAFKRRPHRAEPIYFLTKYYRVTSQHFKAYHYLSLGKPLPFPKQDKLFIERNVYEGLFDYEETILLAYVFNKTRLDCLDKIVSFINRELLSSEIHMFNNVWDNLVYYLDGLASPVYNGELKLLSFPDFDEYKASSCCVIPYKDEFLMNARYVNYSIDERGGYHMRCPQNKVKTANGRVMFDKSLVPSGKIVRVTEKLPQTYDSNIEGLEDIRLFFYKNKLSFNASSKNLTSDGAIRIVSGEYDVDTATISNVIVLGNPDNTKAEMGIGALRQNCQKNWIYVPNESCVEKERMNFLYSWYPMEIGCLDDNNKLVIHTTIETPKFFERFRGSSPLFEYKNKLYAIVHLVKHGSPRTYYHAMVQFNKDTCFPEAVSLPFVFCKIGIEYCLGLVIVDDHARIFFSQNDSNPAMVKVHMSRFRFVRLKREV